MAEQKPETPFSNDRETVIKLMQQPEGKALMRMLRVLYDGDAILDMNSASLTSFRLGQRDVYRELIYLSERGITDGMA